MAINMESNMVASSSNDHTIRCWSLEVCTHVCLNLAYCSCCAHACTLRKPCMAVVLLLLLNSVSALEALHNIASVPRMLRGIAHMHG